MNIGSARRCLTPQTEEVYLIGYRNLENRLHPATGIYDDVFGNALYFEDGGKELFVFSCDFMEIDEGTAEDAKTLLHDRYGIDRDCVLLCATHNHTTVVAYHRTWWTGKFDQEYYDWYLETVASAFEECRANARPATQIMIDTYMAALGFEKTSSEGRFSNKTYEVWDLVPRNVLADVEGDIFVVDAEIKYIG